MLGAALPANDARRDYIRGSLAVTPDGLPVATPVSRQDSSMLRVLTEAECLIVREPHAPAARAGDPCRFIDLTRFGA